MVTRTPSRTPTPCAHHYLLEPNDRPVSRGRCKRCGDERTFANALPWPGAADYLHAWREYPRAESPLATERIRLAAAAEVAQAFESLA